MAQQITIRIRRELRARLEVLAKLNGTTLSQFVREGLAKTAGLPAKSAAAPTIGEGGK